MADAAGREVSRWGRPGNGASGIVDTQALRMGRRAPMAIAVLALVIAAYPVLGRGPGGGAGPPVSRLELNLREGVELFDFGPSNRLVPDGQQLAFVGVLNGSRRLYLRRLDRIEAEPLRRRSDSAACSTRTVALDAVVAARDRRDNIACDGLVAPGDR